MNVGCFTTRSWLLNFIRFPLWDCLTFLMAQDVSLTQCCLLRNLYLLCMYLIGCAWGTEATINYTGHEIPVTFFWHVYNVSWKNDEYLTIHTGRTKYFLGYFFILEVTSTWLSRWMHSNAALRILTIHSGYFYFSTDVFVIQGSLVSCIGPAMVKKRGRMSRCLDGSACQKLCTVV